MAATAHALPRHGLVSFHHHPTDRGLQHFLCSGVIVAPGWVLTVKHLFTGVAPDFIGVPLQDLFIRPDADSSRACRLLGTPLYHPEFDAALVQLAEPPAAALPVRLRPLNLDLLPGPLALNGFHEGCYEERHVNRVLRHDDLARHWVFEPKQPQGHSGSGLSVSGELVGMAVAHYKDPNVNSGCALALTQLWPWLVQHLPLVAAAQSGAAPAPATSPPSDQRLALVADIHRNPRIAMRNDGMMAAKLDAVETHASSLFEARLAEAIAKAKDGRAAQLDAFWSAWREADGKPLDDLAAFRTACDQEDGALLIMDRVFGILQSSVWRSLRADFPETGRNLIRALMLAAAERHMHDAPGVGISIHEGQLSVHVENRLVAEMLAAVHLDCGLRVMRHPQSAEWMALNVLRDRPALVHGDPNAERTAWDHELLAHADAAMSPDDLLAQARGRTVGVSAGPLNPKLVRLALNRLEKAWQVRPMIVLQGAMDPVRTPALMNDLRAEYGVGCFVHSPLGPNDKPRVDVAQLQNTVLRFVNGVFDALDPGEELAPPSHELRHEVFISYAHLDGEPWRQRIEVHLRGLPDSAAIVPWHDGLIETGDDWYRKIDAALQRARCAVLVITPGFLASPFIQREEVPKLLAKQRGQGLVVLPVLAAACVWPTHEWLAAIQAVAAADPLAGRSEPEQDAALAALALQIHDLYSARP